jgi:hypothetical protein
LKVGKLLEQDKVDGLNLKVFLIRGSEEEVICTSFAGANDTASLIKKAGTTEYFVNQVV